MTARALSSDPTKRHTELLANARVRTWHEKRALRSQLSADHDLQMIGLMLHRLNQDPESVVAMAAKEPDRLQDALVSYATQLKRSGRGDAYLVKTFVALKNYLKFRGVQFDRFPELNGSETTTLERERIPSPEELGRVLDRLPLRLKVVALFLAHTGVRPGVLGSYDGESGLTLGDLKELALDAAPNFKEIPFVVRVPSKLSKTGKPYTTFGTRQLSESFLAYLEDRRSRGEDLTPASPVIARLPTEGLRGIARTQKFSGRFMRTHSITDDLAEFLHASEPEGVTWRVYVLRSYCSTRLMLGPMNRDLREAVLGHAGGVSAKYNVGKPWPAELLAQARREYANSAHLLETAPSTGHAGRDVENLKLLLGLFGVPEGTLTEETLRNATPEQLKELAQKYRGQSADTRQKVVSNGEVQKLLGERWTFVASLPDNQVILRPPEQP
jgi:integrase